MPATATDVGIDQTISEHAATVSLEDPVIAVLSFIPTVL